MNADPLSLSMLEELEKRLLTDVEMVRQMKARLQQTAAAPPPQPAMTAQPPAPAAPPPPPPQPVHPNLLISDVTTAVRMVLGSVGSPFGISEVKRQLAKQHFREFGDSTIRSTLQYMKEAGEIHLTKRGLGRSGNRYSLPAPAPAPATAP